MVDRVTLHEELLAILALHGNRWMSLTELAAAVNERGRYHKQGGSRVQPHQIGRRTRDGGSYDHLFERDGTRVRRRDLASEAATPATSSSELAAAPLAARTDVNDIAAVLDALRAPMPIDEAGRTIPPRPGLYAVHGGAGVWAELKLGEPPDDRPLYVGKSESSVLARDIRQHFETGRTGSSTLRRSLAALLAPEHHLRAQPRNPAKPGYFSNYGLEPASDAWLTDWMTRNLELAFWIPSSPVVLRAVEQRVVAQLQPPLNLEGVVTPWKRDVSMARRSLADMARRWQPDT